MMFNSLRTKLKAKVTPRPRIEAPLKVISLEKLVAPAPAPRIADSFTRRAVGGRRKALAIAFTRAQPWFKITAARDKAQLQLVSQKTGVRIAWVLPGAEGYVADKLMREFVRRSRRLSA